MITPAVGGTKYTITENTPDRWKLDSLICIGVGDADKTITLDQRQGRGSTIKPGDNVTCTYANKPKAASLTVVKKADPLTTPATVFPFTVAGGGHRRTQFDLAPTPRPPARARMFS